MKLLDIEAFQTLESAPKLSNPTESGAFPLFPTVQTIYRESKNHATCYVIPDFKTF